MGACTVSCFHHSSQITKAWKKGTSCHSRASSQLLLFIFSSSIITKFNTKTDTSVGRVISEPFVSLSFTDEQKNLNLIVIVSSLCVYALMYSFLFCSLNSFVIYTINYVESSSLVFTLRLNCDPFNGKEDSHVIGQEKKRRQKFNWNGTFGEKRGFDKK